jgi:hypothetical protein
MDQVNRSGRLRRSPLRTACIVIGIVAGLPAQSAAQVSGQLSEYAVKAAFLLNFARFVTWPASAFADAHSPFTICILGSDPFDGQLDQLVADETVEGHKVGVERLKSPPQPKACQILFIGSSEKDLPAILEGVGPGVLTVGEQPGFLRAGGIIRFAIADRHVRFDINQRAAASAALTLSARLLSVARSVLKE